MDFCISRIEHYKMSDVSGVFRESSRNLSFYPHSDVDLALSSRNVILREMFAPQKSIEQQIRDYKKDNGISGRLTTSGKNGKSQSNVMSQAFFKLPSALIEGKSNAEIAEMYADCLDWFCSEYSTAVVVGAYVHFDEPAAGPHMHVNFLPIYQDADRLIFSSSKLFKGRSHYEHYQDKLYAWACEHFSFQFTRRKPGSEKAKHLDLPEFKKAMRELERIEAQIDNYIEPIQDIHKIDEIGKMSIFGGYKITEADLQHLKESARAGVLADLEIKRRQRENEQLREQLRKERENAMRLARDKSFLSLLVDSVKLWFGENGYEDEFDLLFVSASKSPQIAYLGRMNWDLQERLDKVFGTDFAEQDKREFYSCRKNQNKTK